MNELRDALLDYYGTLNEVRLLSQSQTNLASTIEVPEKPEALVLWEKCQVLSLPLTSGGLMDQPHLWLEEVAIIIEIQQLFEALAKQEQEKS